jgi:hypothetical protein
MMSLWALAEETVQLLFYLFKHVYFQFVFVIQLVDRCVHFLYFFFDLHLFSVQVQFLLVVMFVHRTVSRTTVSLHFAVRRCLFYFIFVLSYLSTVGCC